MYDNGAELARELGVDRTTIYRWIKQGKLNFFNKRNKKKCHYKISEKQGMESKKVQFVKQKTWTKAQDNLIIFDNVSEEKLAKMTGRTINAIRVHKTILKKKGLIQ